MTTQQRKSKKPITLLKPITGISIRPRASGAGIPVDTQNDLQNIDAVKSAAKNPEASIKATKSHKRCKNSVCQSDLSPEWKFCPSCGFQAIDQAKKLSPEDYMSLPQSQFFHLVAAGERVPGAGTVAACAAIQAAALLETVAKVAQKPKRAAKLQSEELSKLSQIEAHCRRERKELCRLANEDSKNFAAFYDATRGVQLEPDVEEKFKFIMETPLDVARRCVQIGIYAIEIRPMSSPETAGDMATAFFLTHAAVKSLTQIVLCNLDSMLTRCGEYKPDKDYLDIKRTEAMDLAAKLPNTFECP